MKRIKIPLLYLLSLVLSILPVGIYFLVNLDRYCLTLHDRVKLTAGGVLLVFIVLLKVIGKLKMPSRVTVFLTVLILCYLLERVMADILIFTFLALIGELLDSACHILIRRERQRQLDEKSAEICAREINRALSGRV